MQLPILLTLEYLRLSILLIFLYSGVYYQYNDGHRSMCDTNKFHAQLLNANDKLIPIVIRIQIFFFQFKFFFKFLNFF